MDVIHGGRVITPAGAQSVDIGIQDGRIVALGDLSAAEGRRLDASGCTVLPGAVDPHVHVALDGDDNFQPLLESLAQASRSAVVGGTTTFMAYVRGGGGASAEAALERELAKAAGAFVDYGLHLQLRPSEDLGAAIAAGRRHGVMGYKIMLAYPEKGVIPDERKLLGLLEDLAREDDLLLVHPDEGGLVAVLEERERRSADYARGSYLRSSPGVLEASGMLRTALASRLTGTRVHFVHVSARESVDAVRWLQADPDAGRLSWETQPHYALLTNQAVLDRGALAKVGPPLREERDRVAVLGAVREGLVPVLSSDHAPRSAAMKLVTPDILDAPHGGISGAETLLRLAAEIADGEDEHALMIRLAELASAAAARTFGLYPRKGAIQVGSDADLALVRLGEPEPIRVAELHQMSDYSVYEGLPVRLQVDAVVKGGELLVQDGRIVGDPSGVQLRRRSPRDS